MKAYIVLYREQSASVLDRPEGFRCEAEDYDHAEEQCVNAYPGCDVFWISDYDNMEDALHDYWYGGPWNGPYLEEV
jgi:hypothetical protein